MDVMQARLDLTLGNIISSLVFDCLGDGVMYSESILTAGQRWSFLTSITRSLLGEYILALSLRETPH